MLKPSLFLFFYQSNIMIYHNIMHSIMPTISYCKKILSFKFIFKGRLFSIRDIAGFR